MPGRALTQSRALSCLPLLHPLLLLLQHSLLQRLLLGWRALAANVPLRSSKGSRAAGQCRGRARLQRGLLLQRLRCCLLLRMRLPCCLLPLLRLRRLLRCGLLLLLHRLRQQGWRLLLLWLLLWKLLLGGVGQRGVVDRLAQRGDCCIQHRWAKRGDR